MRADRPLLRFRATWYCTTDLEPAWDVRATGWHMSVDGDPPLDVDMRMPGAPGADGGRVAGLHGQPHRQCRALCLRGPAGNPFDT